MSASCLLPPQAGNRLVNTVNFLRRPVDWLKEAIANHGDIFSADVATWSMVVINHPAYIRHVLVENAKNYADKGPLLAAGELLIGRSLGTLPTGPEWQYHRKLANPAFHREYFDAWADQISQIIRSWIDNWTPGQPFDITEQTNVLGFHITCKLLFNSDMASSEKAQIFFEESVKVNRILNRFVQVPIPPSLTMPWPRNWRLAHSIKRLNEIVDSFIEDAQVRGEGGSDVVSLVLRGITDNPPAGDSMVILREMMRTLIVAGAETTSITLAWAFWLIAQHPEVEQQLHQEIDSVLSDRTPTAQDVKNLPYTTAIFKETLRLYTPIWQLMRVAESDDTIGDFFIRGGSIIFWSPICIHHDKRFWPNPDKFDPSRFAQGEADIEKGAYIPFSLGQRMCLGKELAEMEGVLTLAIVAQHARLEPLEPGYQPEPLPLLSYNPPKMLMRLTYRS